MSNTETTTNKPANLPGLYRHPESGREIVVQANPGIGSAQADGAVQVGFVYVGPAPAKETKTETPVQESVQDVAPEAPQKTLSQMNKTELIEAAEDRGITLPEDATNAEIVEIIKEIE